MTEPLDPADGGLPRRASAEPTGDAGVDAALGRLDSIDPGTDPTVQLPVLMAVHDELQRRLTATEA